MHQLVVTKKSGEKISGWLWTWRPKEGWFEMGNQADGDIIRIELKDVIMAFQGDNRIQVNETVSQEDMLIRARQEGWKG